MVRLAVFLCLFFVSATPLVHATTSTASTSTTTSKIDNVGIRVLLSEEAKTCALEYKAKIQGSLDETAATTLPRRLRSRELAWGSGRKLNCHFACAGFPPGLCFHLHPKCKSYTGKRRLEQIVETPDFHLIASMDSAALQQCSKLQGQATKTLQQDQTTLLPSGCSHLADGIKFQCFYLDTSVSTVD